MFQIVYREVSSDVWRVYLGERYLTDGNNHNIDCHCKDLHFERAAIKIKIAAILNIQIKLS